MTASPDPEPGLPRTGRAVSATPEALRSWLPRFDAAVALTVNTAVTVSETGAYAPPSCSGEPFAVVPHRMNVRVDPGALGSLVACTSVEPTEPDCLQIVSRSHDRLLHRGFVSSPEDRRNLAAMTLMGDGDWSPTAVDLGAPTDAEVDRPSVPASWDTTGHLDAILTDSPGARAGALARGRAVVAHRTSADDLLHVLLHASDLRIPLIFAVPSEGLMHTGQGRLTAVRRNRRGVSLALGASSITLDTEALGETWVTRPAGGPAFFEQYDTQGRCVLVMLSAARFASAAAIQWEHMSAMSALQHVQQS